MDVIVLFAQLVIPPVSMAEKLISSIQGNSNNIVR